MKFDKQALRKAAEKATEGNYVVGHCDINKHGNLSSVYVCQEWNGEAGGVVAECHVNCLTKNSDQVYANAGFIAFASPANVISLLEEISTLEARCAALAAESEERRQFILNGVEFGYIRLPDEDTRDPAKATYERCLIGIKSSPCQKCNDTGMTDSGGTQPWGEPIEIECDCRAAMLQGAEPDFREISNSSTKHFRENAETSTKCWRHTCRPVKISDMRFVVCPECGNKRCPHANDHRNACTGSNEPGQEGSAYPAAPQQEVNNDQ